MARAALDPDRLDVLRALADPTRNALYRELQHAADPLTTQELASRVGLHPNTVRGHLDQLGAAGLVRADTTGHGGRGRPRHRFSALPLAAPAPPALSPPAKPEAPGRSSVPTGPVAGSPSGEIAAVLARSLVQVAQEAGVASDVIRGVGRGAGQARGSRSDPPSTTEEALGLVVELEDGGGYGPRLDPLAPGRWRLAFTTCPFRDLADDSPDVVCSLHAGSLEGTCAATGRLVVEAFTPLRGGKDCHAVLAEDARDARDDRRYHAPSTKED